MPTPTEAEELQHLPVQASVWCCCVSCPTCTAQHKARDDSVCTWYWRLFCRKHRTERCFQSDASQQQTKASQAPTAVNYSGKIQNELQLLTWHIRLSLPSFLKFTKAQQTRDSRGNLSIKTHEGIFSFSLLPKSSMRNKSKL